LGVVRVIRSDIGRRWGSDALAFAAIAGLYLALTLPTLGSFGVLWDEQTDLNIARSYLAQPSAWLSGSTDDPTQTRLPMYTVAGVFALSGRADLYVARLVSCTLSVLTLLAVFVFARRWFGRGEALLAATLLATSPLFLAFSRIALTEGDAFVTMAVAWTVVALARALDVPTVRRTAISGGAFGLAISAKFVAIALVPVFVIAPWVVRAAPASGPARSRARPSLVLGGSCALATAALVLVWFYWYRPRLPDQALLALVAWSIAAFVYALILLLLIRSRDTTIGPFAQPLLALTIAGATFLLLPPVHLTNPVHASSLLKELGNSSGIDTVLVLQAASLHTMTLLFKPSIAVGSLIWICILLAGWRSRADSRIRLLLLCIAAYFLFLLKMRLGQTFYTMPIFPWMIVLVAERLLALWRRYPTAAIAVVAACLASVALDLRATYPHYQLNGYQWVGARYIFGRSTLAYRGVVQVNSDGVEQALEWVNQHVDAGDRVKTFIQPGHIIRAVSPRPAFDLIDGLRPHTPSVEDADYVVTTLHADIRPSSPAGLFGGGSVFEYLYDREALVRSFEPVFRVERPFGLEFATVWRRKTLNADR
jgi:4-amino-4-deoxy-L-arabinose transferase-like glycosyltransferase